MRPAGQVAASVILLCPLILMKYHLSNTPRLPNLQHDRARLPRCRRQCDRNHWQIVVLGMTALRQCPSLFDLAEPWRVRTGDRGQLKPPPQFGKFIRARKRLHRRPKSGHQIPQRGGPNWCERSCLQSRSLAFRRYSQSRRRLPAGRPGRK